MDFLSEPGILTGTAAGEDVKSVDYSSVLAKTGRLQSDFG